MDAVGPLINLGITFVPVPGLKPAFDLVKFIWDNVQKVCSHLLDPETQRDNLSYRVPWHVQAAYNRKALRDLAKSTTDLLKAVNYVMSHTELNENVQVHLDSLERYDDLGRPHGSHQIHMSRVFHEIGMFAKEHATANLFKILVKNIDIEGRNEYFQHRLQQLSMAFSVSHAF